MRLISPKCNQLGPIRRFHTLMSVGRKKLLVCEKNVAAFRAVVNKMKCSTMKGKLGTHVVKKVPLTAAIRPVSVIRAH